MIKKKIKRLRPGCLMLLVGFILMWIVAAIAKTFDKNLFEGINAALFTTGLLILIAGVSVWIWKDFHLVREGKKKEKGLAPGHSIFWVGILVWWFSSVITKTFYDNVLNEGAALVLFIIGSLIVIIGGSIYIWDAFRSDREKKKKEKQDEIYQGIDTSDIQEYGRKQSGHLADSQNIPVSAQIAQLWQLKQEGALTQEEFDKQKAKLLQS